MIDGTLLVTVDPPMIGFMRPGIQAITHECTRDELISFLADIRGIPSRDFVLPKEMLVRVTGSYPRATLARYGLINVTEVKPELRPRSPIRLAG